MMMEMMDPRVVLLFAVSWAAAGAVEDEKNEPAPKPEARSEESDSRPRTATVVKEPFTVRAELQGAFEAEGIHEIAFYPEAWTELRVVEAAAPGARVRRGDTVLRLETEKIDQAIGEAEAGLELAQVGVRQAEENLQFLESTLDLDLAAARRSMEAADEDLLRFLKLDRPHSEKSAEQRLESAEDYLAYEEEELRQLEKMYAADDLTEETEEIILRRQRDTVERMRFGVETARLQRERDVEIDLPRRQKTLEDAARRQTLEWEKARETLPLAVAEARLELEKKRRATAENEERLAKLRRDRAALEVASPADGVVYYGRPVRGRWENVAAAAEKLRRGGALQAHEIVMAVVEPRAVRIRAAVPEKELHNVREGTEGMAVPTGFPAVRYPVRVEDLALVPAGGDGYDAALSVELSGERPRILPGMTCTLDLIAYTKEEATVVPAAAVFVKEGPERTEYVHVLVGESPEERRVKTGRRTGEKVEILDGLEAGERVLLERPEKS